MAIANALQAYDPDYRPVLKEVKIIFSFIFLCRRYVTGYTAFRNPRPAKKTAGLRVLPLHIANAFALIVIY